jgi:metal-responsive CopG/Arc/MetJ family transcriptional regulator
MAKATRDTTKQRKPRPKGTGEPVMVRLQPELAAPLDDWRRKQADLPSRAEAIRRLLELGLKAKSTKKRQAPKQ